MKDVEGYPYSQPCNPDDQMSGLLCFETEDYLRAATELIEAKAPSANIMAAMDAAVGHQIMCRYYAFGRTDYEHAIQQVRDEAERLGCAFPYVVEEGIFYAKRPIL